MSEENRTVRILYTNYRGETALRIIVPQKILFGETEWHPEPQWLLEAYDVEKGASRSFAMKDIRAWIGLS
jgi:predicted DNA-binding transcriptional regulator YafY